MRTPIPHSFAACALTLTGLCSPSLHAATLFELTSTHNRGNGQATAILDYDGDGDLDFVTANKRSIYFVQNQGSCVFSEANAVVVDSANGFGMHDFNADGKMDFEIAQDNRGRSLDGRINNGAGRFTASDLGNESIGPVRNIIFADFDLDGHVDAFHSASAFRTNHHGNQLHPGLPSTGFGTDIIREVLQPPVPGFWYDIANHPRYGPVEWSNKQSKSAVARDLDGDGKPEILFCSYTDRGFQEDLFAVEWVTKQRRGVYLLHNTSVPGAISFKEVSQKALGPNANGLTTNHWNTYSVIPFDYDLDGDYDVFVGATIVAMQQTDLCRLYENVSTPGHPSFIDRTSQAGFEPYNQRPPGTRTERIFAAGAPIDFDNDGWIDLAVVNRRRAAKTSYPYVHLFRNRGDKTFEEIPFAVHGIGNGGGGRDINYGDLDGDGKLDIILSDGSVGGTELTDTTLVYRDRSADANHWIQLDVRTSRSGSWAFGTRVTAFSPGTRTIAGTDDVRTDFNYRSKRHPVVHVGLGSRTAVDVELTTQAGVTYRVSNLSAGKVHTLYLDELTPSTSQGPSGAGTRRIQWRRKPL